MWITSEVWTHPNNFSYMYRRPLSSEGNRESPARLPQQQHSIHPVGPAFVFQLENDPKHATRLCQEGRSSSYLTPRVKAQGLPSAQHPWEWRPKCWEPIWRHYIMELWVTAHHIVYFGIPNMFIHNYDAFRGKPLTDKVCLSLWWWGTAEHCSLPMRCNPLTLTGPTPAFSLMVTGAFSSNSPRLTWRGGIH